MRDGKPRRVDSSRAVMQLMQATPHRVEPVFASVIPVVGEGPDEESEGEPAHEPQLVARKETMSRDPFRGQQQREPHVDHGVHDEERDAEEPPQFPSGLYFARPESFGQHAGQESHDENGSNGVFDGHDRVPRMFPTSDRPDVAGNYFAVGAPVGSSRSPWFWKRMALKPDPFNLPLSS